MLLWWAIGVSHCLCSGDGLGCVPGVAGPSKTVVGWWRLLCAWCAAGVAVVV